jgi:recombination protein RecA
MAKARSKNAARAKKSRSPGRGNKTRKNVKVKSDPLAEYRATMEKQGIAKVIHLSNDEALPNIRGRVSTQSLSLDRVLRGKQDPSDWSGGIPMGRITEIFGPPFIGKSTLLDHIFGSVQRAGGMAVLADTEISRDRHYTERLGVDLARLGYLEFERGESTIENVIRAAYVSIDFWVSHYPDMPVVIGWDALGGTATQDEWAKGIQSESSTKPGAAAKAMSSATRQLAPRLGGTRVAFIIANHEYEMINTTAMRFGKRRETYGGSGVRHAGSVRIQLHSNGNLIKRSDGRVLGREVVARPVKNRLGEAHIEAVIPIITGTGVDNTYTLYQDLKKAGVVVANGAWAQINLDGEILSFQGWQGLRGKCTEDGELFDRLVAVWGEHCARLYI